MSTSQSNAERFAKSVEKRFSSRSPESALDLKGAGTTSLAAWFLGPKAENQDLLQELIASALEGSPPEATLSSA